MRLYKKKFILDSHNSRFIMIAILFLVFISLQTIIIYNDPQPYIDSMRDENTFLIYMLNQPAIPKLNNHNILHQKWEGIGPIVNSYITAAFCNFTGYSYFSVKLSAVLIQGTVIILWLYFLNFFFRIGYLISFFLLALFCPPMYQFCRIGGYWGSHELSLIPQILVLILILRSFYSKKYLIIAGVITGFSVSLCLENFRIYALGLLLIFFFQRKKIKFFFLSVIAGFLLYFLYLIIINGSFSVSEYFIVEGDKTAISLLSNITQKITNLDWIVILWQEWKNSFFLFNKSPKFLQLLHGILYIIIILIIFIHKEKRKKFLFLKYSILLHIFFLFASYIYYDAHINSNLKPSLQYRYWISLYVFLPATLIYACNILTQKIKCSFWIIFSFIIFVHLNYIVYYSQIILKSTKEKSQITSLNMNLPCSCVDSLDRGIAIYKQFSDKGIDYIISNISLNNRIVIFEYYLHRLQLIFRYQEPPDFNKIYDIFIDSKNRNKSTQQEFFRALGFHFSMNYSETPKYFYNFLNFKKTKEIITIDTIKDISMGIGFCWHISKDIKFSAFNETLKYIGIQEIDIKTNYENYYREFVIGCAFADYHSDLWINHTGKNTLKKLVYQNVFDKKYFLESFNAVFEYSKFFYAY